MPSCTPRAVQTFLPQAPSARSEEHSSISRRSHRVGFCAPYLSDTVRLVTFERGERERRGLAGARGPLARVAFSPLSHGVLHPRSHADCDNDQSMNVQLQVAVFAHPPHSESDSPANNPALVPLLPRYSPYWHRHTPCTPHTAKAHISLLLRDMVRPMPHTPIGRERNRYPYICSQFT